MVYVDHIVANTRPVVEVKSKDTEKPTEASSVSVKDENVASEATKTLKRGRRTKNE